MYSNPEIRTRGAALVIAVALFACAFTTALAQTPDKRKQTTIQTAKDGSVEVRYLNLPWGAATFGYMENGGNEYYSTRTWPFAHLKLEKDATWGGKTLTAGNYVLYITPKSEHTPMTLTVASFTPAHHDDTFLVAGDVFTETPKDAAAVATVPVTFDKKEPVASALQIDVAKAGDGHDVVVHYGDRWLTTHLTEN